MKSKIEKWGNSAVIRIQSSVMEAAQVGLDDVVDVREEGGRIIIEPVRCLKYDLRDLIKRIKPGNIPEGLEFGLPKGKEGW